MGRDAVNVLPAAVLLLAGCSSEPPAAAPPAPQAPVVSAQPGPDSAGAGWRPSPDPKLARFLGYVAPKPATWIEHPPAGSMRVANYTVPARQTGNAAHLVIFHFGPGQGGDVESNIARWEEQFEPDEAGRLPDAIVERHEVDGLPVTVVELEGNWMRMGERWYTRDQMLLAAIVESPAGNIFIRLDGDIATVEANRREFMELVTGIRADPAGR